MSESTETTAYCACLSVGGEAVMPACKQLDPTAVKVFCYMCEHSRVVHMPKGEGGGNSITESAQSCFHKSCFGPATRGNYVDGFYTVTVREADAATKNKRGDCSDFTRRQSGPIAKFFHRIFGGFSEKAMALHTDCA